MAAIVLVAACISVYFAYDTWVERQAIADVARCMAAKGVPRSSEADVEQILDTIHAQFHTSWRYNISRLRRLNGC
jgi:hypothetical protein